MIDGSRQTRRIGERRRSLDIKLTVVGIRDSDGVAWIVPGTNNPSVD
jgi:hypothetical protein